MFLHTGNIRTQGWEWGHFWELKKLLCIHLIEMHSPIFYGLDLKHPPKFSHVHRENLVRHTGRMTWKDAFLSPAPAFSLSFLTAWGEQLSSARPLHCVLFALHEPWTEPTKTVSQTTSPPLSPRCQIFCPCARKANTPFLLEPTEKKQLSANEKMVLVFILKDRTTLF